MLGLFAIRHDCIVSAATNIIDKNYYISVIKVIFLAPIEYANVILFIPTFKHY